MHFKTLQRVYVWHLPVRIYHWLNALCVLTLISTGFLIGHPIAITNASEASFSYWFGTVRFIHFVAAFIFFFNFLFRIYWAFTDDKYATWKTFIPYTKKYIKEFFHVLKVDILQVQGKPLISVGHNALAGFTYLLSFIAFMFQCITGFGMYSAMSDSFLPNLFYWIVPLMGGDFAVRQWHHVMMWFFIIFTISHVYIVFYHDYVEGRGIISSMGGGWKFIEKD